jgi:hypothetical protein
MAPELLRYGRLSPAVDIYAFGVMSKCCRSCAHSLNRHLFVYIQTCAHSLNRLCMCIYKQYMPWKVCNMRLSPHVLLIC